MARSAASRMAPAPIASKRGPYAKSSQTRERILAAAFEVAGEVDGCARRVTEGGVGGQEDIARGPSRGAFVYERGLDQAP